MPTYKKDKTAAISFPLGGIGSGCIGLAGNGRLCDWEIFNRSNKNSYLGFTHFAVRVEDQNGIDFRILHGDWTDSLSGFYRYGKDNGYTGFGWGPETAFLTGLPHFRNHTFEGDYPFAKIVFSGEEKTFPLSAELTAWSPFIPGKDRESSLPCAILEYTFCNRSDAAVRVTAAGTLANPWKGPEHRNELKNNILTVRSGNTGELSDGDMTLMLLTGQDLQADISGQEYWYRGGWSDRLEMYVNALKRGGRFLPRTYKEDHENTGWDVGGVDCDHGTVAAHFDLNAGESRTVKFLITWSIPVRENTWDPSAAELAAENGVAPTWKNYYATQWKDSAESAQELADRFDELREQTKLFADILKNSTLDPAIIDGAAACLSTLKSPTCLRLEDGTLYGWEGVGTHWGSCEGSCVHVWNYAQAAPFLFPMLERSLREAHLNNSVDDAGGLHFRLKLPLGIKAKKDWFRPCCDGQFGEIMKFYRDWKITGDTPWLKKYYPTLKRMMEYTWSEANPDQWDPEQSGTLTGRQHHTLDMELFGPNAWLESHYLGALKALCEMASAAGDTSFAEKCDRIFKQGKKDSGKLFNGEYFQQKIDLKDRTLLARWDDAVKTYWNEESGEIKYQIADGLEIDSVLGQFYATFYGIGDVFDKRKVRSTLKAIHKYNYFAHARDHINTWRIYTADDEGGVSICSWPSNRRRPAIPLPYNTETMNGFEWAYASHLMLEGLSGRAVSVARAIRDRYDGKKRNPWNEIECGSNYARSMAAFGMIIAAAGFTFDMTRDHLGFDPKVNTGKLFRTLWSIGSAWGEYEQDPESRTILLKTAGGTLKLKSLSLPWKAESVQVNGKEVPFTTDGETVCFAEKTAINCLKIQY